jgi:hypothetical protein
LEFSLIKKSYLKKSQMDRMVLLPTLRSLIAILPFLVCCADSLAQGPEQQEEVLVPSAGRSFYERNCSLCHTMDQGIQYAIPFSALVTRQRMKGSDQIGFRQVIQSAFEGKTHDLRKYPQLVAEIKILPSLEFRRSELQLVADWIWNELNKPNNEGGMQIPPGSLPSAGEETIPKIPDSIY